MRLTLPRILAAVVVVLLIVGGVVLLSMPGQYRATAFIPAGNPNIIEGAPVLVNGFKKGTVESLDVKGPGAELTISIDSDIAPLHSGAVVFVQWSAIVGERLIQINDGPRSNPEIPDGGRIEGQMPKPMEVSDILRSLDPATRARIGPLAQQLQKTLAGSEQNLNDTLRTAGPAFTAIGNVVKGLAIDEPALRQLVNDTNNLVGRIATRSPDLSGIINDLSVSTRDTAAQRVALRQVLQKLPPTLDQATATVAKVPGTVEETVPLLDDARSATDKLPSVSRNLAPLLKDLRPTIGELKPTLQALSELLNNNNLPATLDSAKVTVPKISEAAQKITPTLRDVRPFTPCAIGFLTKFGGAAGNGDAKGPYVRIPLRIGPQSAEDNPLPIGSLPPGTSQIVAPVDRACAPFLQGGSGNVPSSNASINPAASTGGLN